MLAIQCLLLWIVGAIAASHYPLAVSFGFNYVTAAYVDSANDSVPIVKIEGSEEYQRYMRQLATDSQDRVKRHERDDATEESELIALHYRDEDYVGKSQRMISNILTEVLQLATDAVNFPLEIEATGIPSGLDSLASKHLTAMLLNSDAAPQLKDESQIMGFFETIQLVYDKEEPASDHGPMLYIDYTYYSLDMRITDGVVTLDHPEHTLKGGRFPWFGADSTRVTFKGKIMNPIYYYFPWFGPSGFDTRDAMERIGLLIGYFISLLEIRDYQNLRGFILTGDVSHDAMEDIERVVNEKLPKEWKPSLRADVDPAFVGVVGLTRRAKMFTQDTEVVKSGRPVHDEM